MSEQTTVAGTGAMIAMPAHRTDWVTDWFHALVLPVGLRFLACLAQVIFVRSALMAYLADTSRITLLILVVSEFATFLGLLLSRPAKAVDYDPSAFVLVVVAYCYMVFLDKNPSLHLIPERVSATIQIIGLLWTLYAKVSIGRSFGLLPANRGLVVAGAYRWVRHPINAGYLATHLGFIAANFCLRNVLVFGVLYVAQFLRMAREERLLSRSLEYQEYVRQVRYRLIPGIV